MPLSIFIDALPYTEIKNDYKKYFSQGRIAKLYPNIAYSSTLHWQLYCDKYPDDRGRFVDWGKTKEADTAINIVSHLLSPMDNFPRGALFIKKVLDRVIFRRNAFANIPFRFRPEFSEIGEYLFWDKKVYEKESMFEGYAVISQDEGHRSFEETMNKLNSAIEAGTVNIMAVFGFADAIGHRYGRNEEYSSELRKYLSQLKETIEMYHNLHPDQEVITVSDHGMSNVTKVIDIPLEKEFGKQKKETYIAYSDSAMMCIWVEDESLRERIVQYLSSIKDGHVLTKDERKYYRAENRKFGDILFNLKEGCVFKNSWFGQGLKPIKVNSFGMHGFWPEHKECNQTASIVLQYSSRRMESEYDYSECHVLLKSVMRSGNVDEVLL